MKRFSGSPVPRPQVFTLADGTFVVQWEGKNVQELLTGQYRPYVHQSDFGHAINDYELKQLKSAGRVEHFNQQYVWLYALPERGRFGTKIIGRGDRVRTYYLSTKLPKSQLINIAATLKELNLANEFLARSRNDFVVILGKDGVPFRSVQEADAGQRKLQVRAPQVFGDLSVAFIETKIKQLRATSTRYGGKMSDLKLEDIIASQSNTAVTDGKRVMLVVSQDDEQQALSDLFAQMNLDTRHAATGEEAVWLLEDFHPHLLVMDVKLPDMHGWQLLTTMKEIQSMRSLPIVAIMNEPQVVPLGNIESVVRPVSMAHLRQTIWTMLRDSTENT